MSDLRAEQYPAILVIVLDTNPDAWDRLSEIQPLGQAVTDLLIFINAHLSYNTINKVAVVASHCNKAKWLYTASDLDAAADSAAASDEVQNGDTDMADVQDATTAPGKISELKKRAKKSTASLATANSNKYRPFAMLEYELRRNLRALFDATSPKDFEETNSTKLAAALTMALMYINREKIAAALPGRLVDNPATTGYHPTTKGNYGSKGSVAGVEGRILVLSVSGTADLADQYIAFTNAVRAAESQSTPIDVCEIPIPEFPSKGVLRQASDSTSGVYMRLEVPQGLQQYLLMAFLPSSQSRQYLVSPTGIDVELSAVCFCHKRVVDIGFVCSVCLSIFCEVPEKAVCPICTTQLQLQNYGNKPAVLVRKDLQKKKKKNRLLGSESAASTPAPGPA